MRSGGWQRWKPNGTTWRVTVNRHWKYVTIHVRDLDDVELPLGAQPAGPPRPIGCGYWLVGYWDTFNVERGESE